MKTGANRQDIETSKGTGFDIKQLWVPILALPLPGVAWEQITELLQAFVSSIFFLTFVFERVRVGEGQRKGDTESEAGLRL